MFNISIIAIDFNFNLHRMAYTMVIMVFSPVHVAQWGPKVLKFNLGGVVVKIERRSRRKKNVKKIGFSELGGACARCAPLGAHL